MPRGRDELARRQAEQRRRERRVLAVLAVVLVVVLVGGGVALQAWRTSRAPTAAPAPGAGQGFAAVTLRTGEPVVLGRAGAPVTLTVYEDFHCPHCADFAEEYGPTLADLQDRGLLRVAVYPMAFVDAGSAPAANAFACAAEAGFGQAYYDGLMANATLQWSDEQLVGLAERLRGELPAEFRSCLTGRRHAAWVDSVNSAAAAAGVTQTPTLKIDGQPVDLGTLTPVMLRERVEAAAR